MKKLSWRYILLVIITLSVQNTLSRLNLGQWVTPLLYIVPLIILPTTTPQIVALVLGALFGYIGDVVMGTVALNMICGMAVAMLRLPFMRLVIDDVCRRTTTFIVPVFVGSKSFWSFVGLLAGVECILFFAFETLTFNHILYTLGKAMAAWSIIMVFTLLTFKIIPRR